jgi:hypothetical protein
MSEEQKQNNGTQLLLTKKEYYTTAAQLAQELLKNPDAMVAMVVPAFDAPGLFHAHPVVSHNQTMGRIDGKEDNKELTMTILIPAHIKEDEEVKDGDQDADKETAAS